MPADTRSSRTDDLLPALLGALVVGVGWGLDLAVRELPWSPMSLVQLHLQNPLHFLLDLFPVYLVWAHRQLRRQRLYHAEVLATHRALAESRAGQARTRQLAAAIFDGLLVVDPRGQVVACNPAAELLFGTRGEELTGRPIKELLLGLDTAPEEASVPRRTSRREVLAVEKRIQGQHAGGNRFPCAVTMAPIDTSSGTGTLYCVRDLADEVSQAQTRLNIEVDPRALVPRDDLRESRQRDRKVATRLQQLKGPMAALLGHAAAFRESEDGEPSEELVKLEAKGHELLLQLGNLIDQRALDDDEIELHVETVPVESVVLDAIDACASITRAAGNWVETQLPDVGSTCEVDQRRARDILVNLLVNANQHTTGGRIEVRARRDDKGDHYEVVFEVEDCGSGMSTEDLDAVLYSPDPDSAAIGLQLCKELARQMEGEVTLMSIPDQGTTASLRVPSKDKPTLIPARSRRWSPPKRVQDNPDARTAMIVGAPSMHSAIIREALEDRDWTVIEERAHSALATIQDQRPNLLVFGFEEPQRTWQLWLEIKRHPILGLIPAMCVSNGEHERRAWITRLASSPLDGEAIGSMAGHLHASRIVPRALLLEHTVVRRSEMGAILRSAGWWVSDAVTADAALELAAELPPELVVIGSDVGPESSLTEVLAVIRGVPATRSLPLILAPGRALAPDEQARADRAGCEILGPDDPLDLLVVHATIALSAAEEEQAPPEEAEEPVPAPRKPHRPDPTITPGVGSAEPEGVDPGLPGPSEGQTWYEDEHLSSVDPGADDTP